MTVAKRIKKFLDDKGIKQKAISDLTDLNEMHISDVLNEKRNLNVENFKKIVKAISIIVPGVTANNFIIFEEEKQE